MDVRMWYGFVWYGIDISDGLLQRQERISGFHKMRAVCGLSEELLDSEEVLSPP